MVAAISLRLPYSATLGTRDVSQNPEGSGGLSLDGLQTVTSSKLDTRRLRVSMCLGAFGESLNKRLHHYLRVSRDRVRLTP